MDFISIIQSIVGVGMLALLLGSMIYLLFFFEHERINPPEVINDDVPSTTKVIV
jgi:hypothetical protein